MIQRAHLRLLFRWGFFCSFVAPWSSALSLSSTAISSALKARVAGSRSGALRACTSCMVVTAALAAMAVSLMSRSAVSTWLSSTRRPWSLSSRQLLDGPAHLVPIDDLPGGRGVVDLVGGEQPPVHRLGAGGGIALDHFDQGQRHRLRQVAVARFARARQFDRAEAQA